MEEERRGCREEDRQGKRTVSKDMSAKERAEEHSRASGVKADKISR